jgi:predicted nucleic acid-binding protein
VITYVDTSTLLKLVIDEDGSERAGLIWNGADVLASASMLVVEARATLAAAERAGRLTAAQHQEAKAALATLVADLTLVELTENLIEQAADLAEEEALRGYGAVHLAAALTIEATVMTSADAVLCDSAERRGLHVANPLEADV